MVLHNKHFDANIWNTNPYIKDSHNCYEYALNKITLDDAITCKKLHKKNKSCGYLKHQPGLSAGIPDIKNRKYTCKKIEKRLRKDNKQLYKSKKKCKKGYYKFGLVVNPNKRYHFYRKHKDGTWSHKEGQTAATDRDAGGNKIYNLHKANKKYKDRYYPKVCGEYCIPKTKHRNSSHRHTKKRKRNYKNRYNL